MTDNRTIAGRTFELVAASEPMRVTLHHGDKVTIEDTARILGITRNTVSRMFARGHLRRWLFGGMVFVPWADIENVLANGTHTVRGRRTDLEKRRAATAV